MSAAELAESGESPAAEETPAKEETRAQAGMQAEARTRAGSGTRAEAATRAEPIALHKIPALQGARPRPARPVAGAANSATSGPRRFVGALLLADGSTYPLDRPYVIGRSPQVDEAVRTATAAPLAVPRDRHVSRVHAYVSVANGKVFIRDASTPAGTFIAAPGAAEWTRIGDARTELPPGWSIRIGQRILTYRTDDQPKHPTETSRKRRRS
ncbi:FHA domain-containing protein [Nocardia sp. NBC_00565]|uniref:FHA domain-containing protein n=1 Tax=Nocardia sp. NBC_00565 TaxID=2975993 RepID=UPI002E8126FE|nr:FHA domain-containing protein [Nocardia sp. NBC_00565]WUC03808.1 FHA domain-containing protein [Nocardia sp. NBC_00565]